jgi:hypothetical protein
MTWWAWVLVAIGALIVLVALLSMNDIRRYYRIRSM